MTATPPPSGARRARSAALVLPVLAATVALVAPVSPAGAVPAPTAATANTRPATAVTLAPTATPAARATVPAPDEPAPSLRGLRTPEAASKNLWDAWRDDDRPRALLYASAGAVRTLFARRWDAEIRNQGCGRSNGTSRCLYTEGALAYVVTVSGSRTAGYRVLRVDLLGRDAATASLDPTATTAPRASTTSAPATTAASTASAGRSAGGERTPATLVTGSASAAVRRDAPTPVAAASGPVGQVREAEDG